MLPVLAGCTARVTSHLALPFGRLHGTRDILAAEVKALHEEIEALEKTKAQLQVQALPYLAISDQSPQPQQPAIAGPALPYLAMGPVATTPYLAMGTAAPTQ